MGENTMTKQLEWGVNANITSEHAKAGDWINFSAEVWGIDPAEVSYRFLTLRKGTSEAWDSGVPKPNFTNFNYFCSGIGTFLISVEAFAPDGSVRFASRWLEVEPSEAAAQTRKASESAEPVIVVDDVSMVFNMASEQFNSLKEYFIAATKGELRFKELRALDHVSFTVRRGESFGLVGTNGSGKSTMLKIIAGVLEATEGTCTVTGTIAPLIELGAGFDMELTARENIYLNGALLGYRREFVEEHLDDIIAFAELEDFMDMPLKNYSSGMVARIAFAIATITEPDILIVDETLSVGDYRFQAKCERRIKELIESENVTVLLVSHSIDLVERMCSRVAWIEKGELRMVGPTFEVTEAYKSM